MPHLAAARVAAAVVALVLAAPAAAAAQPGVSYQIPPDNPFAGQAGAAPEIYAIGLRNPFRFSFDRQTGDLLIGDVGGGVREEIDWIGARAARAANFGWPCREGKTGGPVAAPDPRCPNPAPSYVEPLFDYVNTGGVSVMGGFIVRDPALTGLAGRALYADYYAGEVRSLALDFAAPDDRTTDVTHTNLASFGEDASGRLYIADLISNEVRRLSAGLTPGTLTTTPVTGPWDGPVALATVPGDPNSLLVAEWEGRVRLAVNGAAQPGNLLTIPDPPGVDVGGERGLLSVVAAPDYQSSGKLYVYYTDSGGDIRIDEFTGGVRRELMTIEHSSEGNHNGGQLQFGPDGCLWITTGDGGGQNDQHQNGQNRATHLGKILRIDPDPPGVGGAVCRLFPEDSPPPAADATPPGLTAQVKRRQRVLKQRGAIVRASCTEACSVRAGGRLRIRRRSFRMRPGVEAAQARPRVRLKVRLTPRGRRALRRALRQGRKASVRLTLRATDAAGNSSAPVRRTVRVRR